MHYTVYQTTNIVNTKIYIGTHQTDQLEDDYLGSGNLIKRAIKKYGIENFHREILFDFDNANDMFTKEAELVTEEFCRRKDTYNICAGGKGGFGYINSLPNKKEWSIRGGILTGKIISYRSKNDSKFQESLKIRGRETFQKLHKMGKQGKGFLGKTHSNETKLKMSKSKNQGSNNSQFGSMWITDGTTNRKIKKIDRIPEGWYKGRKIKPAVA